MIDDRLRDREMGDLELMLRAVTAALHPAHARLREETGELRYRPPGGASLPDVGERLRDFLAGADLAERPLIVAHDAVVLMLQQLIEPMSEADLLGVPAVANASVTRWAVRDGSLQMVSYNDTAHLGGRAARASAEPGRV